MRTSAAGLGIAFLACTNSTETKLDTTQALPPLGVPLNNRLVFAKGSSIVTTMLDGSDLRRLSPQDEFSGCPALSPDSRSIVYGSSLTSYNSGLWSWFLMQADGSTRAKLVDVPDYSVCPFWSNDGKHFALEDRSADGRSKSIWIFSSDGREEANFVIPGRFTGFSPSGDRLVYWLEHDIGTPSYGSDVYTVRVDGSDTRWIASGFHPSWARDVDLIAFECSGLCVMAGDGSQSRKIVTDSYALSPVLSPNGKMIAYVCSSSVLCIIGSDGVPVARVPDAQVESWVRFRWSADSRMIAYECAYVKGGLVFTEVWIDICTVNADGTAFRRLTNDVTGDDYAQFSISLPPAG